MSRDGRGGPPRKEIGRPVSAEPAKETASCVKSITQRRTNANVSASSPGYFCAYSEPLPRKRRRRRRAFPVDFLVTACGATAVVALLVAAGWIAGRISAAVVVAVCAAVLVVCLGIAARIK